MDLKERIKIMANIVALDAHVKEAERAGPEFRGYVDKLIEIIGRQEAELRRAYADQAAADHGRSQG